MTDEQIKFNIAAATALGWKQCQWNGAYGTLKGVPPIKPSVFQDIPDFYGDSQQETE